MINLLKFLEAESKKNNYRKFNVEDWHFGTGFCSKTPNIDETSLYLIYYAS
jgi:hypothetical protein